MSNLSRLITLTTGVVLVMFSCSTWASGFAIVEHSVKGLGSAFSNTAAAEDASTIFFNAAGLGNLEGTQVMTAGHVIAPSARYTDQGSTINPAHPIAGGASLAATSTNAGGDPGVVGLIPNLYIHHQVEEWMGGKVHLGLGINAPFALKTNWDEGWIGRYHALTSSVKTININLTIAFEVSEAFSVGAGLNPQYIDARLTRALDQTLICFGSPLAAACPGLGFAVPPSPATDAHLDIRDMQDWSMGWNAGFLWRPTTTTRLGLHYRSKITHDVEGTAVFAGVEPTTLAPPARAGHSTGHRHRYPAGDGFGAYLS